jgi:hypothetical protein
MEEEWTKLVEPKAPSEKYDTEYADKENESTTGHLIDRDGCVKKADIHQGCSSEITEGGNPEHKNFPAG